MSTEAQLEANRQNAQFSTGPRTESGTSASSRNAITLGLYTRQDYVKPEEHDIYRGFCERMILELNPDTLLEETLVSEITGASWRLRRCDAADAGLADFDETTDKLRRSVERARSSATRILHRGINQLRRLQADRLKPLASHRSLASARAEEAAAMAEIEAFCAPPQLTPEQQAEIRSRYASPLILAEPPLSDHLASNCSPAKQTPRSAPCPCGSREKFKRCCGKNAPPVLGKAA